MLVELPLHAAVAVRCSGREDFDQQVRSAPDPFVDDDPAPRQGDEEDIRLDSLLRGRELYPDRRAEQFAVAGLDQQTVEQQREPHADPLVPRRGRGSHVQLSLDRLVAMSVVRELLDVLPGDL